MDGIAVELEYMNMKCKHLLKIMDVRLLIFLWYVCVLSDGTCHSLQQEEIVFMKKEISRCLENRIANISLNVEWMVRFPTLQNVHFIKEERCHHYYDYYCYLLLCRLNVENSSWNNIWTNPLKRYFLVFTLSMLLNSLMFTVCILCITITTIHTPEKKNLSFERI